MTNQFSSHTLFAVSYSQIGEHYTDFYTDFTKASQNFETYKQELVGDDYHQCPLESVALYRAQVEIPNTLSFLSEAGLLSYMNSPEFCGKVQMTKLDFLYLQSTSDCLYLH